MPGQINETLAVLLKVRSEGLANLDKLKAKARESSSAVKKLTNEMNALKKAKLDAATTKESTSLQRGIRARTKAIEDIEKKAKKPARDIQQTKEQLALNKERIDITRKGGDAETALSNKQMSAREVMAMNLQTWKAWNQQGGASASMGGKMVNSFRRLTHGLRGFRMEMLGVMFFGQAMNKMFMGLLQPALESAGIFELISTILEVFFLPVALSLIDPLLQIMDTFLGMDEGTQLFIGQLVLAGAAIGTFLMVVGSMALGLGSIVQVFGPLLKIIPFLGNLFGPLIAKVVGFIKPLIMGVKMGEGGFVSFGLSGTKVFALLGAAMKVLVLAVGPLIAAAILLWGAWQKNSAGITSAILELQNAFWRTFKSVKEIIGGAIEFITAIFEGDADKAFEALKKMAKGAIGLVISLFTDLGPAVLEVLRNIFWGIGKFTVDIGVTLMELGGKILGYIAKGIIGAYGVVKDAIIGIPIIGPILGQLIGAGEFAVSSAFNIGAGVANFVGGLIPHFANGGLVTKPTLGLLGENGPEQVVPLSGGGDSGVTLSPTFNINASISNDFDVRNLADQLNDILSSEYRRAINR